MLFKRKIEQFIILFNNSSESGINFLIKDEIINDNIKEISNTLLNT